LRKLLDGLIDGAASAAAHFSRRRWRLDVATSSSAAPGTVNFRFEVKSIRTFGLGDTHVRSQRYLVFVDGRPAALFRAAVCWSVRLVNRIFPAPNAHINSRWHHDGLL
jgi:hypothetical protein